MKRCPKCGTQFDEAFSFCGKCGAKLESVGIDLRKKDENSSSKSDDPTGDSLLESAQASLKAGQYSDCVRQLEKAIKSGVLGAKRMYGCFLDDSEDFRRAAERHRYSEENPLSSVSSSVQSTRTSEQSVISSSSSPDPDALFQEGLAAYRTGQYASAFQSFRRAAEEDHAPAQFYLGECYADGKGVKQDSGRADKWYCQAMMQLKETVSAQTDVEVMICLGESYAGGKGVEKNEANAREWFAKAANQYRQLAEQDNAEAMYRLAKCYENGIGVGKNEAEAVKWYIRAAQQYRRAAEQGDAKAQNRLGNCYYLGEGVDQDYAEAVKWLLLAAKQGYSDVLSQFRLGDCYFNGNGVDRNFAEAAKRFLPAADQGNAEAQYMIGLSTEKSKWSIRNYQEAVKWYRLASEQGNAEAKKRLCDLSRKKWIVTACSVLLILLLCTGIVWGIWASYPSPEHFFNRGVKEYNAKHYKTAIELFKQAAEKGFAEAQYKLGECYFEGHGVDRNYKEAVNWFLKAAAQGYGDAYSWLYKGEEEGPAELQCILGNCYLTGNGFEADPAKAVKLYHKAADQNNADAQYYLGLCYFHGHSVVQNYVVAVNWFRKAAEQGHSEAQYNLGLCYEEGYGVDKNTKEAEKWYKAAAEQGSEEAKKRLGFFAKLGRFFGF